MLAQLFYKGDLLNEYQIRSSLDTFVKDPNMFTNTLSSVLCSDSINLLRALNHHCTTVHAHSSAHVCTRAHTHTHTHTHPVAAPVHAWVSSSPFLTSSAASSVHLLLLQKLRCADSAFHWVSPADLSPGISQGWVNVLIWVGPRLWHC